VCAAGAPDGRRKAPEERKKTAATAAVLSCGERFSALFDLLKHLEDALGRAVEDSFVLLAQAAAFERVAAGAFAFSGHDGSLIVMRIGENPEL
jgi:hypothetical protein